MKRFALSDTIPNPYLTVDAGGAVTVKTASRTSGRTSVEIWCDGRILCHVFGKSVKAAEEPKDSGIAEAKQ